MIELSTKAETKPNRPVDWLSSSAERELQKSPADERYGALLGPIKVVHAFWLAGMSCDGCTISVTGATSPSVEDLLLGRLPGVPRLVLHHPVVSVEAGESFIRNFELAFEGKLNAPYVVIFEGSVADESLASKTGGFWSGMGAYERDGAQQPIPTATWLKRLAPGAAAVIAIGTCATWGGIPAAIGNPTGSMGVMDFLGADYRSALGLPVVNIPGCSPVGDNFSETVAAVLLFLNGLGPLPEFDDLGRPAWLFNQTVHQGCNRAGFYEEGIFDDHYGGSKCLVELGCWGPVVNCNIARRGAINHVGGCMNVGGICIGCTMPGFPDATSPFYGRAPGTLVSSSASRVHGGIIRNLRRMTNRFINMTNRWHDKKEVPTGWGHVPMPAAPERAMHYFYQKLQWRTGGQPVGNVTFRSFYGLPHNPVTGQMEGPEAVSASAEAEG